MSQQQFKPGDRCSSPSYGIGRVQEPPWLMPCHTLMQFDDGRLLWILTEILQPPIVEVRPLKSRRGRKSRAA